MEQLKIVHIILSMMKMQIHTVLLNAIVETVKRLMVMLKTEILKIFMHLLMIL